MFIYIARYTAFLLSTILAYLLFLDRQKCLSESCFNNIYTLLFSIKNELHIGCQDQLTLVTCSVVRPLRHAVYCVFDQSHLDLGHCGIWSYISSDVDKNYLGVPHE